MENPRENRDPESLLAELNNAHAREAATREILDLVVQYRDDQIPVFNAILKNATRLCHAPMALLGLLNNEKTHIEIASHIGARTDYFNFLKENPPEFAPNRFLAAKAMQNLEVLHIEDITHQTIVGSEMPHRDQAVSKEGMRTVLFAPMQFKDAALGCIILYRREVRPFSVAEIDLVQTFASQAVIAVENIRQFHEVQIRLHRETATKNILSVMSKSRDDEVPVFDAILTNATRLCNAPMAGLVLVDTGRKKYRLVASRGAKPEFVEALKKSPPDLDPERFAAARAIIEKRVVHVEDLASPTLYGADEDHRKTTIDTEGIRTTLFVPLIWNNQSVGAIGLWRREVSPFRADEIDLVETFAAQAVIAIENVRQFREIQTKLEREAATSEVLSVISQSRDDDQRVFDALLGKVVSLSDSAHGSVWLIDKEGVWLETVARNDSNSARASGFDRRRMDATDSAVVSCVRDRSVWRMDDLQAQPGYHDDPNFPNREWMSRTGARSMLLVPLLLGDTAIGLLAMYRSKVQPYSQEHVALIESFAAQAVIAIENTRQFKALETLNTELGERVNEQVGELERMGRLKRFLPSAVADAVVSAGDEGMLSSHRALIATLFCDMRGFTAFCEAAEPEETIEVLQMYHHEMSELIDQYGGGVDQRAGDGIMVIFNDPIPCDDPAGDAVKLALAMRDKMRQLCAKWKKLGHRLGFGVGISFGYATVGLVGAAGRFDYTASGTSVNTAARLCDLAANDEILISPRAWAAVEGDVEVDSRGEVEMKGIREPVEVFAVVAE